jgi:hypothetical protein
MKISIFLTGKNYLNLHDCFNDSLHALMNDTFEIERNKDIYKKYVAEVRYIKKITTKGD